jgi:hypothetical protein
MARGSNERHVGRGVFIKDALTDKSFREPLIIHATERKAQQDHKKERPDHGLLEY